MKKSIVSALLVSLTAFASTSAIADLAWTDSYQQDTLEYYVDNAQGASLAFDCKDDGTGFVERTLFVSNGKTGTDSGRDNTTIIISMGGKEYQMINPDSNAGRGNWSAFFDDVKKSNAKTLTVTIDGVKVKPMVFSTDNLKNILKTYSKDACSVF